MRSDGHILLNRTTNAASVNVQIGGHLSLYSGVYCIEGLQVVGARNTGWTAWTGTAAKGTFDTASATTANCAQAIKALTDLMRSHGLTN